jgi:hypothetical protein
MDQELKVDTMNWDKIYKSAEKNNRGGRQPKMGRDGPAQWFGRTRGFGRTHPGAVGCRVVVGRCGLAPNDGWRVFPTILTVTTVIGRVYKPLILSISTHTSASSLIFSEV